MASQADIPPVAEEHDMSPPNGSPKETRSDGLDRPEVCPPPSDGAHTAEPSAVDDDAKVSAEDDALDGKDDASVSSSSTSSSLSSEESAAVEANNDDQALNYMEKRAQRIARNEEYLHSLGLLGQNKRKSPRKRKRNQENEPVQESKTDEEEDRGILLPLHNDQGHPAIQSLEDLYRSFPGREVEIRAVYAHLDYSLGRPSSSIFHQAAIPNPLWITGTGGTGKSGVLRSVIQYLVQQHEAIDTTPVVCHVSPTDIPPPITVKGLVICIYRILLEQLGLHTSLTTKKKTQRKSHQSRRDAEVSPDAASETAVQPAQIRRSRRRTVAVQYSASSSSTQAQGRLSKTSRVTAQDMAESTATSTRNQTYTAVWKLGQWCRTVLQSRPCVLVLDGVWMVEEFNLLAQFLLLPQVVPLNMTVIVVTQNALLDQTPLSVSTSNSSGSLATSLLPARIHFPAYRSKLVLEQIVLLPRIQELIAPLDNGCAANDFQRKVYRSFARTLVQSTYEMTKNVKEIIRFGRVLWPQYIDMLQPSKIQNTLEVISRRLASFQPPVAPTQSRVEQELLTLLDSKALSNTRTLLEDHLFALSVPAENARKQTVHDMPKRAKYLLLAAYLCQVNRPDRDKHLFTIQKSGRRRKTTTEQNTAAEDTAFGTNAMAQPKKLRLRTFPLERMLSIFVSLVSLHQGETATEFLPDAETERLLSLGDTSLVQNVQLLQNIGLLHEQREAEGRDPIRLSGRRYWCELTEDEALRVAETINLPLARYVL